MHTFLIPVYVGKVTDCWDKSPKTVSSSPTLCKAAKLLCSAGDAGCEVAEEAAGDSPGVQLGCSASG